MSITDRLEALKADINKHFPEVWTKDGDDFGGGQENTIWTGEGSQMPDGLPAFDPHCFDIMERNYVMGVHKELRSLLNKHDFYAEQLDGGTFFLRQV